MDLSPFLSNPAQWVERLAILREERQKIESQEEKLRDKLKEHMAEKKTDHVDGSGYVAKLESNESVDFSRPALEATFGLKWMTKALDKLPKKTVERLVVRAVKSAEVQKEEKDLESDFMKKFGGVR